MDSQQEQDGIGPLECDPQRKSEMIRAFKQRLDDDTNDKDVTSRVLWLFEHLEEYLARWLGFVRVFRMKEFIHNDLHIVLHIAIDIIDEEYEKVPDYDSPKAKWRRFAATVRSIGEDTDENISDTLRLTFQDAKRDLLHAVYRD
jgi:hypothetical protein